MDSVPDPPDTGGPTPFADAATAAAELQAVTGGRPVEVAVVLGSGLGAFAEALTDSRRLAMDDVHGFVGPTVPGHAGEIVAGRLDGRSVLVLAGRVHLYEGHDPHRVCHGVRTAAALGARVVVLTNAAGAIDPEYDVGSLVRVGDHLNLTGVNPLTGPRDGSQPGFVDLTTAYDADLRAAAAEIDPDMHEGVYAALAGPSFETPAEIRMLATMGATLVGMSTACETIASRQLGMRVAAFSLVTNRAAGLGEPLSHTEVTEVGRAAATSVVEFLTRFVPLAAEVSA